MAKAERNPRVDAAYEVVPGITADEAAAQGLAVVEYAVSGSTFAPVYGRYLDTTTGAALEQLVHSPGDQVVVPAGGETANPGPGPSTKSNLLNPNDPVVHGTANSDVHADGSDPRPVDIRPELEAGATGIATPDKKTGK